MAHKVEIQVIDDKMLIEGLLQEKLLKDTDPSAASGGEYNLVALAPEAKSLILSFNKINRIENLIGFDVLTKLCLDNNFIDEIANLGHLVTLRWLDLSFNNIKKIQGLDTLVNLEDLSLYSNKISVVEGLDKCVNLKCLSLGNNKISSLEQVIRLRKIRSLRMLTLKENAVCKETEYRNTVLAYVDNLKYLDYNLIDAKELSDARDQYHDEIVDVQDKESVIAEKIAREAQMEQYMKKLDDACILFAHTLFDDLFADDGDVERLKHMPGVKDQIEQFKSNFKNGSEEYIRSSLEKFDKKKREISLFYKAVQGVRSKDEIDSTMLIEKFTSIKKEVADKISFHSFGRAENHKLVKSLQDELEHVSASYQYFSSRKLLMLSPLICIDL
jgi:hypothetical protein